MAHAEFGPSPWRWIVLIVFMLINIMVQVLWICYSPIAAVATQAFGAGIKPDDVRLLGDIFLLVYIPVAFPAAWAIDKFGIHKAVGFGAAVMAVFALLRALMPNSYDIALISSIGIAVGQPFILSAFTKIAGLWFPKRQRATITGVMFLSLFAGVAVGEAVTPMIVTTTADFPSMNMIYGIATIASVVLFLLLARARPKRPVEEHENETRALMLEGMKNLLKNRNIYFVSILILLGSAVVNGMFIDIDAIATEKLFPGQGGVVASIILLGSVVGSVILPAISDALKRRKAILVVGTFVGGAMVIVFSLVTGFVASSIVGFLIGFFLSGAVPVGYQYGAEITHPTPEGTSNGFLGLILQAAGFLIVAMDGIKTLVGDRYMPVIGGLGVLIALSTILIASMRESPEVRTA